MRGAEHMAVHSAQSLLTSIHGFQHKLKPSSVLGLLSHPKLFQSQETLIGNSGWEAEKCHLLLEFSEKSVILLELRDNDCYAENASFKCAGSWALDVAICRGGIRRRGEGWGFACRLIKQRGLLVALRNLRAIHDPGLELAALLL